jgi:Protein of unknown function (DUF2510)
MRFRPRPAPNWYSDPTGQHDLRYWDGTQWTQYVSSHGATTMVPPPVPDPSQVPPYSRRFSFAQCNRVAWRTAPDWAGPGFAVAFLNALQWWLNDDIPRELLEAAESENWREAVRRLPEPWGRGKGSSS